LTGDYAVLRAQWQHWLEHEMAWLDDERIPVYHTTSNHVTYDEISERIFREVLPRIPHNGPADQLGLSYFVRRGSLLLVFINTSSSALGGDGWVETEWLERTLSEHADARYKLVLGHQAVFSVNGSTGPRMREIVPKNGQRLWSLFVKHGVLAYLCSHMLCFDVQVQEGVLQILTAGAGTAHLSPGEYLHCTQCALDEQGLRYQTLASNGRITETLRWPLSLSAASLWQDLSTSRPPDFNNAGGSDPSEQAILAFAISGVQAADSQAQAETLLSAWQDDARLTPLWFGLCGPNRELTVILTPVEGKSPQIWRGPELLAQRAFSLQVALHRGMGPGGILWRWGDASAWTSLRSSASWGAERLQSELGYCVGHDRGDTVRNAFRGSELRVTWHASRNTLR
jgi:hypothetical protein